MEVPRHWRLRKQRYAMIGKVCFHCAAKIFPPRDICPICGGEADQPAIDSRENEVYAIPCMDRIPTG